MVDVIDKTTVGPEQVRANNHFLQNSYFINFGRCLRSALRVDLFQVALIRAE
jgi:hypothetical protein